ncbi:serine hydroxymethyltransferase [Enterocytozoon bieneusi H348]|nr:serine hydroxymethyltransferase [Enterocytozoon bieneusi H348]|eukprot:XP_002650148.1 serine hydroxymethyltransferase [Enterocytozoon bieneusi H348]
MIYQSLEVIDPEVDRIIRAEEERQRTSLELIASENFAPISVLQASASVMANKYSEGQVGARYYGGTENIDELETLCKSRALALFSLDPNVWDVNVQPLSGSNANLAVYLALIGKDGRLMGLDLPSGGHLTHGYKTSRKKISASSIFFESMLYKCNLNGEIDYDALEAQAIEFKPGIIVCGGSAYPLDLDYQRLRQIAGDAYLMTDMAHISGFIATGIMNNAFKYSDVVTTTTHKLLRGPRSAMIFYRKKKDIGTTSIDVKSLIDSAVFPGLNGGPHNQKIAALAVALKLAATPEYSLYCAQVLANAKAMAARLAEHGFNIISGRTECHLVLFSCKDIDGASIERVCELAHISLNKNSIISDQSPLRPSGVRIGTPAMTTRGFREKDCIYAADLIAKAVDIARKIKQVSSTNEEFNRLALQDQNIKDLKAVVISFVSQFPIPKFNFRISEQTTPYK